VCAKHICTCPTLNGSRFPVVVSVSALRDAQGVIIGYPLIGTDPHGIITDVNKQMVSLIGCSRDELIGAPFKHYFSDSDRVETSIKLALSENKTTNYELTSCQGWQENCVGF